MHFGHGEPTVQNTMNDINLERTKEEKDLGVLITDDLQPSSQSAKAAKKAKSALALLHNIPYHCATCCRTSASDGTNPNLQQCVLHKSFKFFEEESFRILYKTYVRSHMETCIQAWAPYKKKDIQSPKKSNKVGAMVGEVSLLNSATKIGNSFSCTKKTLICGDLTET